MKFSDWSFITESHDAPSIDPLGNVREARQGSCELRSLSFWTVSVCGCSSTASPDESVHTSSDLPALNEKYDCVNIKLDKSGGLTAAIDLKAKAHAMGFDIMVGCMVGTSLAMAPALLLASDATLVDLDGPLLLAKDRDTPISYDARGMHPVPAELWG